VATVTVVTAQRVLEIEAASITSASIVDGHLVLVKHDGTEIDVGAVSGMLLSDGTTYEPVDAFSYIGTNDPGVVANGSVWFDTDDAGPAASVTQKGLVELATSAETATGTDATRAVTPAGLASIPGTKVQVIAPKAETDIPSAYPIGTTLMSLSSGSGWTPNAGFGHVITNNISTARTSQFFFGSAGGSSTVSLSIRSYNTADGGGGWTAWQKLALENLTLLKTGGTMTGTVQGAFANGSGVYLGTLINGETFDRFRTYSDGWLEWGDGGSIREVKLHRSAPNTLTVGSADLRLETVGRGIRVAEGTGAKMGVATLNGTTGVVVSTGAAKTTSRIFLTTQTPGGTVGTPIVVSRVNNTSFTIRSTAAGDTSTVAWLIMDPA